MMRDVRRQQSRGRSAQQPANKADQEPHVSAAPVRLADASIRVAPPRGSYLPRDKAGCRLMAESGQNFPDYKPVYARRLSDAHILGQLRLESEQLDGSPIGYRRGRFFDAPGSGMEVDRSEAYEEARTFGPSRVCGRRLLRDVSHGAAGASQHIGGAARRCGVHRYRCLWRRDADAGHRRPGSQRSEAIALSHVALLRAKPGDVAHRHGQPPGRHGHAGGSCEC